MRQKFIQTYQLSEDIFRWKVIFKLKKTSKNKYKNYNENESYFKINRNNKIEKNSIKMKVIHLLSKLQKIE